MKSLWTQKEKNSARSAVGIAIKSGKLRREPCAECGVKSKIEAHHYLGYKKKDRLCIKWLCKKHHKATHKTARTGWFKPRPPGIQWTVRQLDKRAIQALKRYIAAYKRQTKRDLSSSNAIIQLVNESPICSQPKLK